VYILRARAVGSLGSAFEPFAVVAINLVLRPLPHARGSEGGRQLIHRPDTQCPQHQTLQRRMPDRASGNANIVFWTPDGASGAAARARSALALRRGVRYAVAQRRIEMPVRPVARPALPASAALLLAPAAALAQLVGPGSTLVGDLDGVLWAVDLSDGSATRVGDMRRRTPSAMADSAAAISLSVSAVFILVSG